MPNISPLKIIIKCNAIITNNHSLSVVPCLVCVCVRKDDVIRIASTTHTHTHIEAEAQSLFTSWKLDAIESEECGFLSSNSGSTTYDAEFLNPIALFYCVNATNTKDGNVQHAHIHRYVQDDGYATWGIELTERECNVRWTVKRAEFEKNELMHSLFPACCSLFAVRLVKTDVYGVRIVSANRLQSTAFSLYFGCA